MKKELKKLLGSEGGLICQFVLGRIEARQEVLGLSHEKFAAALLVGLTKLKQTDIAEALGLSYASLRIWASRDAAFKEVANWGQGAFATVAASRLREIFEKSSDADMEIGELIGEHPAPDFFDASLYTRETLDRIAVVYFMNYTTAGELLARPDKMFARVTDLVFGANIPGARRIVERRFLDRINAFLRVHKRPLLARGPLDPAIAELILLYVDLEANYQESALKG